MDYSYYNEYNYPTHRKNDLCRMIGDEIVDIIKCSYETYNEYVDYEKGLNRDLFITEMDYFQYSFGFLLIKYKSEVEYSFCYLDVTQSVSVNLEKNVNKLCDNYALDDKDIKDIRSIKNYPNTSFYRFLNKKIIRINILTKKQLNSLLLTRPCEYWLEFIFQDGSGLVLGFGIVTSEFSIFNNNILPSDNVKIKETIF